VSPWPTRRPDEFWAAGTSDPVPTPYERKAVRFIKDMLNECLHAAIYLNSEQCNSEQLQWAFGHGTSATTNEGPTEVWQAPMTR
jgi:hypothetical protein